MTTYIPATNAQPLSDALWALSRPAGVRGPKDTQFLFPWVTALDRSLWLAVDTECWINVHVDADFGALAGILQPFVDSGELTSETLTSLKATVEETRGKRLAVYDAFPQYFKDQGKDFQEMVKAELLAAPGGLTS